MRSQELKAECRDHQRNPVQYGKPHLWGMAYGHRTLAHGHFIPMRRPPRIPNVLEEQLMDRLSIVERILCSIATTAEYAKTSFMCRKLKNMCQHG